MAEILILYEHKVAFDSLISDLNKKNPHWDRKSVDEHSSTSRALFTEKILSVDGKC